MANFCKVIIAGRLTRNPVVHAMDNGESFTCFSVAINKATETVFVDVESYGHSGCKIALHAKKGSGILLDGTLRFESKDSPSGGPRISRLKVILHSFQFIGHPVDENDES